MAASVFDAAAAAGVAVIARVPLASGLLSGRYAADTAFAPDDHRAYNRHGEAFDVGETFAGVPYEVGLEAVERLRPLVPEGVPMARWALRCLPFMRDRFTLADLLLLAGRLTDELVERVLDRAARAGGGL